MLPLETKREGDKITKVCVEDVYKIINRVYKALDKAYNNSSEILESVHKIYESENGEYEGELIIGTGVAQPCEDDIFDEEVGNEIAFKKAKLNANEKKLKLLEKVYRELMICADSILKEVCDLDYYVERDLRDIRHYNPAFRENYFGSYLVNDL